MWTSFSELFEVLTEDQRDCLRAKLTAAIEASRVVENDYAQFSEALDSDYPDRYLDLRCGTVNGWNLYTAMTNALSRIYDRMAEQPRMRDELADVRACI